MNLKFLTMIVGISLLLFNSNATAAGNITKGKAKAAACIGCHGAKGIAIAPNFPNLAGQKQKYLLTAIQSYQNGKRKDPTMKAMVVSLNNADIENLAAYFSSLSAK